MCKISVIIPVYNGEKDIEKCISKLTQQTFHNIEIIVINDGSTDKTEQICKQLLNQDKRIRLYTQENMGPAAARNKGIELSKGEWIVFVDSDDWLEIDCLEYVYQIAEKEENTDIVLWNLQDELNEKSIKYMPFKEPYRVFIENEINSFIITLLTDRTETKSSSLSIKGPVCKLIKREIASECYFPIELNLGEDVCFAHQVYDKVHKLVYINKMFYHRIINENSLSQKTDVERGEKRSNYANWVLKYRANYDKDVLNEFVYIRYKELALYYMDPRIRLPYKLRKKKIENFLMNINWKIDFENLQSCHFLFLLKHRMYFTLYICCMTKNKLYSIYRCSKEVILMRESKKE